MASNGTGVSYHPAGTQPSLKFSSALHPTYSPSDVPTFEAPVIIAAAPQVYSSWDYLKQSARESVGAPTNSRTGMPMEGGTPLCSPHPQSSSSFVIGTSSASGSSSRHIFSPAGDPSSTVVNQSSSSAFVLSRGSISSHSANVYTSLPSHHYCPSAPSNLTHNNNFSAAPAFPQVDTNNNTPGFSSSLPQQHHGPTSDDGHDIHTDTATSQDQDHEGEQQELPSNDTYLTDTDTVPVSQSASFSRNDDAALNAGATDADHHDDAQDDELKPQSKTPQTLSPQHGPVGVLQEGQAVDVIENLVVESDDEMRTKVAEAAEKRHKAEMLWEGSESVKTASDASSDKDLD